MPKKGQQQSLEQENSSAPDVPKLPKSDLGTILLGLLYPDMQEYTRPATELLQKYAEPEKSCTKENVIEKTTAPPINYPEKSYKNRWLKIAEMPPPPKRKNARRIVQSPQFPNTNKINTNKISSNNNSGEGPPKRRRSVSSPNHICEVAINSDLISSYPKQGFSEISSPISFFPNPNTQQGMVGNEITSPLNGTFLSDASLLTMETIVTEKDLVEIEEDLVEIEKALDAIPNPKN